MAPVAGDGDQETADAECGATQVIASLVGDACSEQPLESQVAVPCIILK